MSRNIILCGIGGQGTVLASKLIASAAMDEGMSVMSAETIGMAQRGGSVFSNLRIGEGIHSPHIGKGCADLIIGFEPGEVVRMLPYLKKDGTVVTNDRIIMSAHAMLTGFHYDSNEMISFIKDHCGKLITVDGEAAIKELGTAKALNIVLLGAAVRSGAVGLSEESVLKAMDRMVNKKFEELNKKAFSLI